MRLIFVRHGETDWNKTLRFRGRIDVPLNCVGVGQAQQVAKRLGRTAIAAVYSSPLSRTLETATPIGTMHGLEVVRDEGWIDFDYGMWQGRTPADVAAADAARYRRWLADPARVRLPRGETVGGARDRILRAANRLARRHPRGTVVVVSHDMVGRILVVGLLGLSLRAIWRIGQDNGAMSIFEQRSGCWFVESINDTGHLAGSELT